MIRIRTVAVFSLALAALACADPAADKPRAEVGPAAQAPAEAAPPAAAAAWKLTLDPANTRVEFVGSKITGSHTGVFERLTGEITAPGDDPAAAAVRVSIELASVKTDSERLDGHLRSPDFFEVERFPTAVFESTAIAPAEGAGGFTVTGNLTLHGVTRSISFPARISRADGAVTARAIPPRRSRAAPSAEACGFHPNSCINAQ
jgi:polyisoprenoid-binding protein YceI